MQNFRTNQENSRSIASTSVPTTSIESLLSSPAIPPLLVLPPLNSATHGLQLNSQLFPTMLSPLELSATEHPGKRCVSLYIFLKNHL